MAKRPFFATAWPFKPSERLRVLRVGGSVDPTSFLREGRPWNLPKHHSDKDFRWKTATFWVRKSRF